GECISERQKADRRSDRGGGPAGGLAREAHGQRRPRSLLAQGSQRRFRRLRAARAARRRHARESPADHALRAVRLVVPDVRGARAVPARSGPDAGGGSQMVMVTWPAITACTDSPLLLYGMWTNPVPVFCLNSSVAIWNAAALEP